jgi:hypothetical protein
MPTGSDVPPSTRDEVRIEAYTGTFADRDPKHLPIMRRSMPSAIASAILARAAVDGRTGSNLQAFIDGAALAVNAETRAGTILELIEELDASLTIPDTTIETTDKE